MGEVPLASEVHETHEERQSLWLLVLGPAIWTVHFGLVYATASVWCAKLAADGSLGPTRGVVAGATVIALAAIGVVCFQGWRRHTYGGGKASAPHDDDSPEDRHRFLGFATLLLGSLSAVATLFVAGSAFFFETCR